MYGERAIEALCARTVNLIGSEDVHAPEGRACRRFGGLECRDHRFVDAALREEVFDPDGSGRVIGLGQRALVKLVEAAPVTGGLIVDLVELDGATMPRGPSKGRGKPAKRRLGKSRAKAAKTARKVKRRRK